MREGPFLVRALALAAALVIPLRVVGLGFLPTDDALRHAAKAVSGRPWSEILVLRPEVHMDSHPGWHILLGLLHRLFGASAHSLVLFSVVALFFVFCLPALLVLRRGEAWLIALAALAVTDPAVLLRLFMGRPFILSAALLILVCLTWRKLDAPGLRAPRLAALAVAFGMAAWTHPSWYLFAFPITCFFLTGRRRAAGRLLACLVAGVLVAALLSGHPFAYLTESLLHPYLAFTGPTTTLANEFRPYSGSPQFVILCLGLLLWRALRGRPSRDLLTDPVFAVAAAGWVLGFQAARWWTDWGVPAALVFLARTLEEEMEGEVAGEALARVAVAAVACAIAVLVLASDVSGRYSSVDYQYLPLAARELKDELPEPGGILYTDDMPLFYLLFFRRPEAPWRYVVGYEPGLMRPEDLAVYRSIIKARTPHAFAPWVARMRPEDRLIIRSLGEGPPPIPGLGWRRISSLLWSGRVVSPSAPPTPRSDDVK